MEGIQLGRKALCTEIFWLNREHTRRVRRHCPRENLKFRYSQMAGNASKSSIIPMQ